MKVNDWLKAAKSQLDSAGIGTARLDALVLLEDVTGVDRASLLAEPEREIKAGQLLKLKKLLTRRAKHEPLAYVLGRTEFYGRQFVITSAVLEPRPESETMIDMAKQTLKSSVLGQKARVADIGSGSGALGITLKLECPEVEIDLLELDEAAIKVSQLNVDKFTLSTSVIQSDLLANAPRNYDLLLCNLPYVPDSHTINEAARYEPDLAIFGGLDGLDVYRHLFNQITKRPQKPLYILSESLPPQHKRLQQIAQFASYRLIETFDFIQLYKKS